MFIAGGSAPVTEQHFAIAPTPSAIRKLSTLTCSRHLGYLLSNVKSQGFPSFPVKRFYTEADKPPSSQTPQVAMAMCEAKAQFDGPTAAVGTRLIKHEGALDFDLYDEKWRMESRSTGEKSPIRSLVRPSQNASTRCSTLFPTSNSLFVSNLP